MLQSPVIPRNQVSTFPVVLAANDVAVETPMQTHLKDLIETVGMTGGQGSLCLKNLPRKILNLRRHDIWYNDTKHKHGVALY
jgi:hypothetical protein